MENFCVDVPFDDENAMDEFQKFMDACADSWNLEASKLAIELNISEGCANDILYLQTRSRWTQEKEDYLIWLCHNKKDMPNIMDDFEVPENYKKEL